MSVRACSYKNCENFTVNNLPNGDYTIFQFPKDPYRKKQWMELGCVNPNIAEQELFMCSRHFDKRFMSSTSRRTILVGAAIPFSCEESAAHENNYSDLDEDELDTYVFYEDEKREDQEEVEELFHIAQNDEYHVGSTVKEDAESRMTDHPTMTNNDNEILFINSSEQNAEQDTASGTKIRDYVIVRPSIKPESSIRKRKFPSDDASSPVSKGFTTPLKMYSSNKPEKRKSYHAKAVTTMPKCMPNTSYVDDDELDETEDAANLIDSQQVTAFLMKGEEYVQMTKEYYIQEKSALLDKLKGYELTLKSIRDSVDELDIP